MVLLLAKILVSILAVVGLSLVAERVSARVAGVLSGYPLGSAIALYFIGVEQGSGFAADAAIHTLAGFSAGLVLTFCYYHASRWLERGHLMAAAVAGVCGFLLAATLLQWLPIDRLSAAGVTAAAILLFGWLFRKIDNVQLNGPARQGYRVLLFRALMAAATVLLITGIAGFIGPAWSGVLAAFPITLFPFMLILHHGYGRGAVYTVIKNYPMGLGALLCYALTVSYCYRWWGVDWGTVAGFVVASGYLYMLYLSLRWRARGNG